MDNFPILTALRLNDYWLHTVKSFVGTFVGVSRNHHSFSYDELPLIVEAAHLLEAAVPRGLHKDIRLDALFDALWWATRRNVALDGVVEREVARAQERMKERTGRAVQEAR